MSEIANIITTSHQLPVFTQESHCWTLSSEDQRKTDFPEWVSLWKGMVERVSELSAARLT